MQQNPSRRIAFPPKDFLDDSASVTSSTIASHQKFLRKTDERSATRRPISKGSRDRSAEWMNMSRFYRKMGGKPDERAVSPRRNIITRQEEQERNRKRSPTPLPGHQKRREKTVQSADQLQIELKVCELQTKLACQQQQKQVLAKRVTVFQREIKAKLVKIQQLQGLLAGSQQREAVTGRKLQQFQAMIVQRESNLSQARSSLQKMKNIIKQNKYAQLQTDNIKITEENSSLKQQLHRMSAESMRMGNQVSLFKNEVTFLRKANEHLANSHRVQQKRREIEALQRVILTSKTQKQRSLQQMVDRVNRQNAALRLKLQKLQLKLNLISRKRNQQLQAVKQSKNDIIIKLKNKISTIFQLNHTLRAQNDQLRNHLRLKASPPQRKNNFIQQGEQCMRLQLSP